MRNLWSLLKSKLSQIMKDFSLFSSLLLQRKCSLSVVRAFSYWCRNSSGLSSSSKPWAILRGVGSLKMWPCSRKKSKTRWIFKISAPLFTTLQDHWESLQTSARKEGLPAGPLPDWSLFPQKWWTSGFTPFLNSLSSSCYILPSVSVILYDNSRIYLMHL